jgi:hypothetical protein
MEIWRDIKGYEGLYAISNHGRVKSYVTNKLLSPQDNGVGYLKVELWNENIG